ncbi:BREX-2 system phosphatase PglZ [Azospirillum sp.]|uniref:BREX-2 system phosphatase PglZ n=1 Tax=Azospirillum sp. TaxID=34012 RepID=UPI003D76635E
MTFLAPTTAQIRAQVEAIVRHDPRAQALGIRSPTRQPWPERLECAGRAFDVVWCDSTLAARQALCNRDGDAGLVLLTALPPDALGDDVVARLAKARLLTVEAWEMVREAFQARNIDPRIAGKSWLAELMLEHAHRGPYPLVPGGLLDAETAWANVLERALGLPVARPDVEALLHWCIGDGALSRFTALPPVARSGVAAWLSDVAGPAGGLVITCIESGFGADALPLGLVAGVVFGTEWLTSELTAASVRLEPFVGGRRIPAEHGRSWAAAAARALRPLDEPTRRRLLERADALLDQIHARAFAASSPVLLAGFEARLASFSEALATTPPADLRVIEATAERIAAHDQASVQKGRAERVVMALRLVRWLSTPHAEPASFADAVATYTLDGAFVDRARLTLAGGDEMAALSSAYAALAATVRARREVQNERFAGLLRSWNVAPAAAWPLVPVERVLEEVVAPLAKLAPVLLLVMDGLSHAVYRELLPDLMASGWGEILPDGQTEPASAVAMLPTVTVVSRASLLCGRPQQGGQSTEKAGFTDHPALRAESKAGCPPILYHKGDLSEGGALAPSIREAVGTPARRVVAIIHNAIDDHLDGPEQVRQRWSLDDLHLLRPILHEARNAGRVVVLTADHGHLIEVDTRQIGLGKEDGKGDRWRRADGNIGPSELSFAKGRVLTPEGDAIAVLPWSESIRYAARKNGYHGGATPQEVLVPLAVLSAGVFPVGWVLAPPVQPEWWEGLPPPATVATPRPRPEPVATPSRKGPSAQPSLFDAPAQSSRAAAPLDWVGELLTSPVYAAQKQLAGRGAPKDEDVRAILEALIQRGGKLSRTALAQRLGVAQVRVGSLIMATRRVLNVDQVQVLEVEEASGTVVLNRALLDTQFELKG